jgi:hypothetical protein
MQSAEFLNAKTGGTYSYHCAVRVRWCHVTVCQPVLYAIDIQVV